MALQSQLFRADVRLERCLSIDSAHVTLNQRGDHVEKIQRCLTLIGEVLIRTDEIAAKLYGQSTADAVLDYKRKRNIVNFSYQKSADNIVGKMTMAAMDAEMLRFEAQPPPLPLPSSRFAKFIPEPPKSPSGLQITGSTGAKISPLGPFVQTNGFDPDPRRDGSKSSPNESFQMVPNGGTRVLLLLDPGLPDKPVFRLSLRGADGQPSVADFVSFTQKAVGRLWEITISGLGSRPGNALLEATNISTGRVEATLRISVLAKRGFSVGFLNTTEPSDKSGVNGTPADWLQSANNIWLPQANIELRSAGSSSLVFSDEQPTILVALKLRAADYLDKCKRAVPNADRYVVFIKEIVGVGSIAGDAVDVIFMSKKLTTPDDVTFAHEFGHSLGESHFDPPGFVDNNLMATGQDRTILQTNLVMQQILRTNLNPGTFRDVK